MSAIVKQNKTKQKQIEECHMTPGVRPEKAHLAPEVKMGSETVTPRHRVQGRNVG
jgi:hypothetical protein